MADLEDTIQQAAGEGVALLTTKMRLRSPVKLNVRPLETEMVASPGMGTTERNAVDGIRFDEDGDPLEFDVLREHPGGGLSTGKADRWPAEQVLHLFREDRAGQHRGIPETTPALPLFSQLRRFTLATLAAAETAAEYAAVIETQLPADSGGWEPAQSGVASMDVFELAQRMVTVLPDGYKLNQVKPEHPATTYGEFKREILGEAFAALCMPFNVGAHDSSEFNYSSGKLDRLSYGKLVFIERYDWRIDAVLPVFRAWFDEAAMIPGYLPPGLPPMSEWIVVVHWDGQEDIDPVKAAQAREIELRSGQRTLEDIYAERGEDAETKMERQAQLLGMTLEDYQKRLADKLYGPDAAVLQQQQQEQQNKRKERDNATAA